MATPQYIFEEIAQEHGVDPRDHDAVTAFFRDVLPNLPAGEVLAIEEKLMAADGAQAGPIKGRGYPKNVPLPKMKHGDRVAVVKLGTIVKHPEEKLKILTADEISFQKKKSRIVMPSHIEKARRFLKVTPDNVMKWQNKLRKKV